MLVALGAVGCGNKGKLKSPAQMEYEQEKAERRAAKKDAKMEDKVPAEVSADVLQADPNTPRLPAPTSPNTSPDNSVLYRKALPPVPSNDVGE